MSTPTMSAADRAAHDLATYIRPQPAPDVTRAVVRYGICRDTLAELDGQAINTPRQFNALASAQDGLAEATEILAAAGMLHLVEAGEHDKVKDPLPPRPRGPHPYPTGTVAV